MEQGKPIAEPSWLYPIAVGLGSIPVTLLFQRLSIGDYVLAPVLSAGVIAGYLVAERPISSRRAGWRAGLIGGLALSWGGFRFLTLIPEYSFGLSTSVLAGFSTALVVGLYIVYFGLVGGFSGFVGGWLAGKIDGPRSLSVTN
ncbi:hypothetical protein CP556_03905 [Natrinema sp. CBA1119]|uniref:DUF5518 domain-containing protein n=1 Tax=Natrinema sp. CBA1119 TaxID=1608465 RepID=UPI000BF44A20|nr:DUF5518 domain-containing protein [Natrinema sp. CBA1119]PGF15356.1 hypothetical protein CP556_03905 [Natrinema sp. CBA1119]